jgi:arylsulfatase A-like enzyme
LLAPLRWIVVLAGLALAGCASDRPGSGADGALPAGAPERVLLISVDTLRRDHLGCYGSPRGTSPHVDALARRGAVYTDVMTVAPWTLPSHTSLLTGLSPANHRVREDSAVLPPGLRTIAEIYRDAGYLTVGVVSHDYVSSVFGLDRGFRRFDDSLIQGFGDNPTAARVVDRLLDLLPSGPEQPFFAFVHFFDPHWKYEAPGSFDGRFTDPAYSGEVDGALQDVPNMASTSLPPPDLAQLRGLYDAEIAALDRELGRLLRSLEARGLGEDLLVVFTADHGEEFQEHGGLGHGRSVFEEEVRVPLVIAGGAEFADPRPRRRPVSLIDVAPTLAHLVGSPAREELEGVSLLAPEPGDRVRVAESIQFGGALHAARLGRYKWIRTATGEAGFDLETDPGEQHALRTDPTGGRLGAALDEYVANADHGWHLKIVALQGPPVTCRATVRTESRIVRAERHFPQVWQGATRPDQGAYFTEFEISPDAKELRFDLFALGTRAEIVFETEPPDAPVTLEISLECDEPAAGVFAGAGTPLPQGQAVEIARGDPRVRGLPRGYPNVPPGCYVRVVDPPAEASLPAATEDRLRALGYLD